MKIEALQLDFFADEDSMITQHKLMRLDETLSRVRKGTYAQLNHQRKLIDEMEERLSILERNICCGRNE